MDPALANLGWTEDQWNRICSTVAEEAQRARVVAQALPSIGLDDPNALAIPEYRLSAQNEQYSYAPATQRLRVDSNPTLHVSTISVNVPLRAHEVADPQLRAALVMFRRAANYVARIEDALALHGRPGPDASPPGLVGIVPPVFRVTGDGAPFGLFLPALAGKLTPADYTSANATPANGDDLFNQIIAAIDALERRGATGPFACILSHRLFELACTPNAAMVLPRDRILPFLQGPLLRSGLITNPRGCVVALGGDPIELVVARDINVSFVQSTTEPRQIFRVAERVALRIKEPQALAMLG